MRRNLICFDYAAKYPGVRPATDPELTTRSRPAKPPVIRIRYTVWKDVTGFGFLLDLSYTEIYYSKITNQKFFLISLEEVITEKVNTISVLPAQELHSP